MAIPHRQEGIVGHKPPPSVLVVNPNPRARARIVSVLEAAHFDVTACATGAEALELLRVAPREAMVVDAHTDDEDGIGVLKACHAVGVTPATIMTTERGEIRSAVTAFRAGFRDYVAAPFDERLSQALRKALALTPED
jgi:DNA-binding NtrC family response regulator